MKKNYIFLLLALFLNSFLVFSQEVNKLSRVKDLSKGHLVLNDGTKLKYKNLMVINDTAFFSIMGKGIFGYSENDISKITKTGNYALEGAIILGLNGLWISAILTKSDKTESYYGPNMKQIYLFALAGGLIGIFIPKEILIYKHISKISFSPDINIMPNSKPILMLTLTCRIN